MREEKAYQKTAQREPCKGRLRTRFKKGGAGGRANRNTRFPRRGSAPFMRTGGLKRNARFCIMFSGRHRPCGQEVEETAQNSISRRDLRLWCGEILGSNKTSLFKLRCGKCATSFEPSHLFIVEIGVGSARTIVPVTKVDSFDPKAWPELVEVLLAL